MLYGYDDGMRACYQRISLGISSVFLLQNTHNHCALRADHSGHLPPAAAVGCRLHMGQNGIGSLTLQGACLSLAHSKRSHTWESVICWPAQRNSIHSASETQSSRVHLCALLVSDEPLCRWVHLLVLEAIVVGILTLVVVALHCSGLISLLGLDRL